jgi:hypothetical protein
LRERRQHAAALVFAIGAAEPARAQAFEAVGDLVEIAAHLLDLVVDRTALRAVLVEQREEATGFAAHALGLGYDAVEFALLARLRFLVTADLFILGGIAGAGAAVDGGKLAFEPLAHRIATCAGLAGLRRCCLRRRALRHLVEAVVEAVTTLRESVAGKRAGTGEQGAGEEPPGEGIFRRLQHIRPLKTIFAGGLSGRIPRPTHQGAANAPS